MTSAPCVGMEVIGFRSDGGVLDRSHCCRTIQATNTCKHTISHTISQTMCTAGQRAGVSTICASSSEPIRLSNDTCTRSPRLEEYSKVAATTSRRFTLAEAVPSSLPKLIRSRDTRRTSDTLQQAAGRTVAYLGHDSACRLLGTTALQPC